MPKRPLIGVAILLLIMHHAEVYAEKPAEEYKTFTAYLENDVFKGTDREYTNGLKLTWISQDLRRYRADPRIPEWSYPLIERLPFVNEPGLQRNVSLSIGQNIFTPDDKERSDLIEEDRPYAGITYLAIGFHSKNQKRMDTLEIDMGIVGPHSYAEQTQKTFHKWIGNIEPNGWGHQLNDELLLNLYYERKWKSLKLDLGQGFAFDCIPHIGCALGNALTAVNLGSQIRFGWNLPNDFGTFLIRPGSDTNAAIDSQDPRFFPRFHRFGIHVFAGLDERLVIRNILLDGNTFSDSHRVNKEPLVGNYVVGVGIIIQRLKLSYSHVFQTKEFKGQPQEHAYGSITASYSY